MVVGWKFLRAIAPYRLRGDSNKKGGNTEGVEFKEKTFVPDLVKAPSVSRKVAIRHWPEKSPG